MWSGACEMGHDGEQFVQSRPVPHSLQIIIN